MNWITRLWSFGRRRRVVRVEADDEGLRVLADEAVLDAFAWSEVHAIQTMKLDLLTTDTVRLEFIGEKGELLTAIDEELSGFAEVANQLTRYFPSIDPDWIFQVMRPAFERNFAVLYRR